LNSDTLAAEETIAAPLRYPAELDAVESSTEGMQVNWQVDQGGGPDADIEYLLRWETLPSSRDQARAESPAATELRLYGIRQGAL
jgi:hypothetical protein